MQPLFNPDQIFTLLVSPSGGGKTTRLITPNALSHVEGSLFVNDPKGEILRAVGPTRIRMGRTVIRLDTFHVLGPGGHTLNVLDGTRYGSPCFHADTMAIADALIIKNPNEKEPHFNEAATDWAAALIVDALRHFRPQDRSLQTIRSVLTDGNWLVDAIGRLAKSDDEFLRRAGGKMLQFRDRELGSVLTTLNRHLSFLDDPLVYAFTRRSSFDAARALLDGNCDIFFIMPPHLLRSHNRLPRLVLTAFLRMIVQAGADRHRRVLFLLDEAASSLGKFDVLADAITQLRGYGLRMVLAIQALAQLQQMFPEGQHSTILANTDQIYLNIRDWETLEAVSKRLGETTVRTFKDDTSGGDSRSEGASFGTSRSHGWSTGSSETGRALLRPEEVAALGDRAVVFLQNLPPLLVQTCPYYQDPAFAQDDGLSLTEMLHCLCALVLSLLVAAVLPLTAPPRSVPAWQAPRPPAYPPARTVPAPLYPPRGLR